MYTQIKRKRLFLVAKTRQINKQTTINQIVK